MVDGNINHVYLQMLTDVVLTAGCKLSSFYINIGKPAPNNTKYK